MSTATNAIDWGQPWASRAHVNGIDVSDWQEAITWPAIRSQGYSFAFCKATEGGGYSASTFLANMEGARAAGLIVAAYHFFDWSIDGAEQAEHFLSRYAPQAGDHPPWVDAEGSPGVLPAEASANLLLFLRTVDQALGRFHNRLCGVYTGYYVWLDGLGKTNLFNNRPLWLAQYGGVAPRMLGMWRPAFWQYSDTAFLEGIGGREPDRDWFFGTRADLMGRLL